MKSQCKLSANRANCKSLRFRRLWRLNRGIHQYFSTFIILIQSQYCIWSWYYINESLHFRNCNKLNMLNVDFVIRQLNCEIKNNTGNHVFKSSFQMIRIVVWSMNQNIAEFETFGRNII